MSRRHWRNAEARAALLFLAPGLFVVTFFFLIPVAGAFLLAFTDLDIYALADPRNVRIVGLENFTRLLHDRVFGIPLRTTLFYVLVGGPLTVLVSLGAPPRARAEAARG